MSLFLRSFLSDSTPERRHKAQEALNSDQLAIIISHQDERQIRALVKHGDHAEHGVTLTEHGGCCGCRDFAYRGLICFHQVATAIYCLQHPEPITEKTHLQWSSGALLCSEPLPLKVWRWPWPMGILSHQEQWPEVQLCQACVHTYTQPVVLQEAA